MTDRRSNIDSMIEELKQTRDELALKIHLASAEVRDEWEDFEKKLDHVRGQAKRVGEAVGEAADDVGDALGIVADELKQGYERIRKLI